MLQIRCNKTSITEHMDDISRLSMTFSICSTYTGTKEQSISPMQGGFNLSNCISGSNSLQYNVDRSSVSASTYVTVRASVDILQPRS